MKAANHEGTVQKVKNKNGKTVFKCRIFVGDEKKKFISRTATTATAARTAAKAAFKRYKKEKAASISDASTRRSETVAVSVLRYFDELAVLRNWKQSTQTVQRERVQNMIVKNIGPRPVSSLSAPVVNDFIKKMLLSYSRENVGKIYHFLRHYVHDLSVNGIIEEDFFRDVVELSTAKKSPAPAEKLKVFSIDEIEKLREAAIYEIEIKNDLTKYFCCMFFLLFITGMRSGELRALTADDIDFDKKYIHINKAFSKAPGGEVLSTTKTKNSTRTIKTTRSAFSCIEYMLKNKPSVDCPFLCCTKKGNSISSRVFLKDFNRVLEFLGIPKNDRSPHTLRHSFISLSLDRNDISPLANKSPLFVSQYVGHAKLSTTMDIYAHIHGNILSDVDFSEGLSSPVLEIDI